jgi:hypothetical protein
MNRPGLGSRGRNFCVMEQCGGGGICLEVEGIGVAMDGDASCEFSCPMTGYSHRKAFHLRSPHIAALSSASTGEESERSKKRKRSKALKAEKHPDATPPWLLDLLSSALSALTGPTCPLFSGSSTLSIAAGAGMAVTANGPAEGARAEVSDEPDLRMTHSVCDKMLGGTHKKSSRLVALSDARSNAGAGGAGGASGAASAGVDGVDGVDDVDGGEFRNRPLWNTDKREVALSIDGHRFVVPSAAGFYLGQAEQGVESLVAARVKAGLAVVDPPWPCKSRGIKYEEMPLDALQALEVGSLVHEGGIIGVWVTNNDRLVDFVRESLLPAWGCRSIATWYWLKVGCVIAEFHVGYAIISFRIVD